MEFATRIDDLPDNFDNKMYTDKMNYKDQPMDNISLDIKQEKEKSGFFSTFLGSYFNEDALLLILFLIIRTFPLNNFVKYIPVVNSLFPESGLMTTIITSVILAFIYITIIKFK
jgi:translation elongation factor EF-G